MTCGLPRGVWWVSSKSFAEVVVGAVDTLKRATARVAAVVTRVLLFAGLALVYLLGVGPTALVTAPFAWLGRARRRRGATALWRPAAAAPATVDDALRQS